MNPTSLSTRGLVAGALIALAGCGALPDKPVRPAVFDFGPGSSQGAAPADPAAAPLVLAEIEAPPARDGTAMLYRLAYADAREARPYAQSRWAMPPPQLLRQRLVARLAAQRPVVAVDEAPRAPVLRVELEEFSQLFEAPDRSAGLVRLRATVVDASAPAAQRVRQRLFVAQRPAPSADAAGGVRALSDAADAAVDELARWLAAGR